MGIGTLGFLKGASSQVLSSLEARDTAERELKKQKELEKFRADLRQQEEMKKAVTFQTYTDAETGKLKVVGYNSQNQRLEATARDATQPELDAKKQGEEDRGWILKERDMKEKDFKGDESERAQRMRIAAASDARAARSYSTAGAGAGAGGGDLDTINLSDAPQLALSRAAEEVITVDPGISRLIGDYAIPTNLVEVIKKDAIGQALRDPNAKSPVARAQLASTIMRRSILEAGSRYPRKDKW